MRESWSSGFLEKLDIVLEVVRTLPGQSTFVVLPCRWVVEPSPAWIYQHRRCVRDYQRLLAHHEREEAFWKPEMFTNQNSACKLRNTFTLTALRDTFGLE